MQNQKPKRKSIRLRGFDYSEPREYFVTICSRNRKCIFGEIINQEMALNELGKIVEEEILNIPNRFKNVEIKIYTVMPNHIHLIVSILEREDPIVGATLAVARKNKAGATLAVARNNKAGASPAPTIGAVIGSFKSLCFKKYKEYVENNNRNIETKFWRRNYYEHIIRNEKSYDKIYAYIESNSQTWERDRNHPENA